MFENYCLRRTDYFLKFAPVTSIHPAVKQKGKFLDLPEKLVQTNIYEESQNISSLSDIGYLFWENQTGSGCWWNTTKYNFQEEIPHQTVGNS